MFKNEFQGGPFLEVLTIQGKESQSRYQSYGLVKKDFDKDVKSYVLSLEGDTAQSKICLPKNDRQTLHILQRYIVLQLLVPLGAAFSLEIVTLDSNGQKRRLLISTSHKEICVTSFHVKIPLILQSRGIWNNLCLDVKSFVEDSFKACSFKAIERITVTANCRLRKIISMKHRIPDETLVQSSTDPSTNDQDICDGETASRLLQLNVPGDGKTSLNQVCNIKRLLLADVKLRQSSGLGGKSLPKDSSEFAPTHIAFGSRSLVPKSPFKGHTSSERSHSTSSSSSSIGSAGRFDDKVNDQDIGAQIDVQQLPFQPRPPKQSSGPRKRRPNPRLRVSDSPVLGKKNVLTDEEPLKVDSFKTANHTEHGIFDEINSDVRNSELENSEYLALSPKNGLSVLENKSIDLKDPNNNNENHPNFYDDTEDSNKAQGSNNLIVNELSTKSKELSHDSGLSRLSTTSGDGLVMGNSADLEDYFNSMKESEESFVPKSQENNIDGNQGDLLTSTYQDNHTFLYSSQPRRPSKSQRLYSSSDSSVFHADESQNNKSHVFSQPPDVVVTELSIPNNDRYGTPKSTGFASLESDFVRQSSDSEDEKPIDRFQRTGKNQRLSPLPSLAHSPSLPRSSRLKDNNNLDPKKSPVSEKFDDNRDKCNSCHSDSMSWIYDSDTSQKLSGSISTHGSSDPRDESGYHEDAFIEMKNDRNKRENATTHTAHQEKSELGANVEVGVDSDDYLTDDSDETSFSVWQSPPSQIRNYRYQDEMRGIGMTLDLSATLPMTPFVEETDRTMPILTSETKDSTLPNDQKQASGKSHESRTDAEANVLDLMYDPMLNCYYDPKTHHYYELA